MYLLMLILLVFRLYVAIVYVDNIVLLLVCVPALLMGDIIVAVCEPINFISVAVVVTVVSISPLYYFITTIPCSILLSWLVLLITCRGIIFTSCFLAFWCDEESHSFFSFLCVWLVS